MEESGSPDDTYYTPSQKQSRVASFAWVSHPNTRIPAGVIARENLHDTLTALEATPPVCVYTKQMVASDRDGSQNRLLISCKKNKKNINNGEGKQIPCFDDIFTEQERLKVHHQDNERKEGDQERAEEEKQSNSQGRRGMRKKRDKDKSKTRKRSKKKNKGKDDEENQEESSGDEKQEEKGEKEKNTGLAVRAYDRAGRPYDLKWKFLSSNTAYRIIGPAWRSFLQNNGLLGDIERRKRRKPSPKKKKTTVLERALAVRRTRMQTSA